MMQQANAELEQHAAERRRALHEVADRLRKRERDLQEVAEREGNDAAQRIQIALGDVERRQVEQLQRIVAARDDALRGSRVTAVRHVDPHARARKPRAG